MAGLKVIDKQEVINICPNNSDGPIIEIESLSIQLPKPESFLSSRTIESISPSPAFWPT